MFFFEKNLYIIFVMKINNIIMKQWTWKQWTALGLTLAVVIAAVVCHLVQPAVSYAWLEMVSLVTFILGVISGYLLKKNDIVKS